MFAGENFCKLDEKGRFLLPPYIRDLLCPEGQAGVTDGRRPSVAMSGKVWHDEGLDKSAPSD